MLCRAVCRIFGTDLFQFVSLYVLFGITNLDAPIQETLKKIPTPEHKREPLPWHLMK